jgi:hypothetical protein
MSRAGSTPDLEPLTRGGAERTGLNRKCRRSTVSSDIRDGPDDRLGRRESDAPVEVFTSSSAMRRSLPVTLTALNAMTLAMAIALLGPDGPTGTFSHAKLGRLPW